MPLRQPSFSMASGADLPSAASDGDSQSESDVIPVQRNEADFVPETEEKDEDVSSDAGVVEPAKKKKQGNIRVGRYDYMLMLRSISAKRLFVFLDTALPPWVACFCLRVTVSFQSPNGGESFDMYALNFKYCALHVCPSCSVFIGIMHPCMICNSTPLFISRVHVHHAHF